MRIRHIAGSEEEIAACPIALTQEQATEGKWEDIFGNDLPLRLEIGSGRGQFILNMALAHPEANFVGIDLFSDIVCRAVRKWERSEQKPENMRLLVWDATLIESIFDKGEADRIYLNFSDPWPKKRHEKRRLTSPVFLQRFYNILREEGQIEFKTDNLELFKWSLEQFELSSDFELEQSTFDLHADPIMKIDNIQTEYEEKFSNQGEAICKLIARKIKRS